jgi:2-polyprenyl-3-methyl-5-hydroxy-6-metoxy-1,4-benzoquinol methylase
LINSSALQEPVAEIRHCDLCGASRTEPVLESGRLDGPLVRCVGCGLHYVGHRSSGLAFGNDDAAQTSERIGAANNAFSPLPRSEERRLNELNARWRLELIGDRATKGRLLEVGCGRGDFLRVAAERFDVSGVEPNPALFSDAVAEARVHRGRIEDVPDDESWMGFDVAASFHVIEHVDSPSSFVRSIVERLRPGGLLVLETPDIGSTPYRLLGARWRQFIPEHYYFFDRSTLTRLLETNGLRIIGLEHVGKHASLGLLLNRIGRQIPLLQNAGFVRVPGTIRINPRDILLALAVRQS